MLLRIFRGTWTHFTFPVISLALDTPGSDLALVLRRVPGYNLIFLYSGNPLNCDCQTKWLRNWVSAQTPSVTPSDFQDEPRCYFPKSLSGNPLRQLRSSRFVCNPRETTFISDACNAMPLKTPAQIHLNAVTDTGEAEGWFDTV